jgi:hypothetical protein
LARRSPPSCRPRRGGAPPVAKLVEPHPVSTESLDGWTRDPAPTACIPAVANAMSRAASAIGAGRRDDLVVTFIVPAEAAVSCSRR